MCVLIAVKCCSCSCRMGGGAMKVGWMSFSCFISSNREALTMHIPFLNLPVNSKLFHGLKKKKFNMTESKEIDFFVL